MTRRPAPGKTAPGKTASKKAGSKTQKSPAPSSAKSVKPGSAKRLDSKVLSMTGFGAGQATFNEVTFSVEIRSVNSRHLSTKVRLPQSLARHEKELDDRLRRLADRGSFDVYVRMRGTTAEVRARIDLVAMGHYFDAVQSFMDERKLGRSLDPTSLLALPGAVVEAEAVELDEATSNSMFDAFDSALVDLLRMRESEGSRLLTELKKRLSTVEKLVDDIEVRSPLVVADHHKKLKERVEKLLNGERLSLDDDGLRREIALLADKLDVSEELDRLRAHMAHFSELLDGASPVGRKLDFLLQEFGREANTIGSKVSDEKVARVVVELKSELEKIREQVQNIE